MREERFTFYGYVQKMNMDRLAKKIMFYEEKNLKRPGQKRIRIDGSRRSELVFAVKDLMMDSPERNQTRRRNRRIKRMKFILVLQEIGAM